MQFSVFKGEWLHGRKHGMGIFTTKDKSFREVWHEGVIHLPRVFCCEFNLVICFLLSGAH